MNEKARAMGRRVLPLYQDADKYAAEQIAPAATCKKGCTHCCHNLVAVSVVEMVPIAEQLLTSKDWRPKLPELKKKLEAQAKMIEDMGGMSKAPHAYLDRKTACVFLTPKNECAVYRLRPMSCRLYYVKSDPADCSPEKNGQKVLQYNTAPVIIEFLTIVVPQTREHIPPALDSMQKCLLVAIALLEKSPKDFDNWVRSKQLETV